MMGESTNNNTQSIADYLAQLLKDKKQLAAFPNVFLHVERILDDEIAKVRGNLFQINGKKSEPLQLPDGVGPPITQSDKVYVPIKDYPEFNFVGRILGPRGMTTKQLEQETGCKIMVRGKGSMRDKKKEDQNRGKPNWEHLNDDLHVLITVEDSENRAKVKLNRAVEEVKKLLKVNDGEDELKKRQLMELAIINGTYRDSHSKNSSPGLEGQNRFMALSGGGHSQQTLQSMVNQQTAAIRNATPLGGAPLILSSRLPVPTTMSNAVAAGGILNGSATGGPPPLIAPGDTQSLLYAQYAAEYASNYSGLVSPLLAAAEYSAADPSGVTAAQQQAQQAAVAAAVVAAAGGKERHSHIVQNNPRHHPYNHRN